MNLRTRRTLNDYADVKEKFADSEYIDVDTDGLNPPEEYTVTYHINGLYMTSGGEVAKRGVHHVKITFPADYPGLKPVSVIQEPIWHPNFNVNGQICIGDEWGAEQSLADIIVYIGNMIQYKEYNIHSPLSYEAAEWAQNHEQLLQKVDDKDLDPGDDSDVPADAPFLDLGFSDDAEAEPVTETKPVPEKKRPVFRKFKL